MLCLNLYRTEPLFNMQFSIALLLLTVSVPCVIGFSTGPPITIFPGVCQSLDPTVGHGQRSAALPNQAPYQITTATATDGSLEGKR